MVNKEMAMALAAATSELCNLVIPTQCAVSQVSRTDFERDKEREVPCDG